MGNARTYIFWIAIVIILFLLLSYFFPILPCKTKTVKTSASCTPELEAKGQCKFQEIQETWKFCSLKSALSQAQTSKLELR